MQKWCAWRIPATTQNFGVIAGALAQQQARESGQPNEITARVVGVATRARGELVLTLDNGQVWEQTQGGAKFPVKVDDTVTIRTGAFNSYKLVAVSGKTTKVTRIK